MSRNEIDYRLAYQMVAFSAVAADESQAPGTEASLVSAEVSSGNAWNEPCCGNAGRRCKKLAPVHVEPRVLVLFLFFVSVVAPEDIEMKKRRHQEVRHIDQLVDVEVDRGAGEHVGLLARQPPGPNEVIDHVERRIPGRERQIFTLVFPSDAIHRNPRRGKEALRHRSLGRGEEIVPLKLESGDAQPLRLAFPNRKLDVQGDVHLHRGAGDLAVTLREVSVARRKERPGHEYGNEKPAAFGQLLDVDVPRVLARGNRAQAAADERPAVPA